MGWVRLNSSAQCGLGGVPVPEDTGCPPPPPCEALKHALYGEKKDLGEITNEARDCLSKMTPNITISNSVLALFMNNDTTNRPNCYFCSNLSYLK